jgi:hypothetical protein
MRSKSPETKSRLNQSAASIEARPDARLGWRIDEWMAATSTSRATVARQIKTGQLKVAYIGTVPLIPRTEAIRLGLIPAEVA